MGEVASSDDMWRLGVLAALGLGLLVWCVGGLVGRVAGRWRQDDGLAVDLRQLGPVVWGISLPPGGRQRYSGQAVFGRVRLRRHDYGAAHLAALGFDPAQARAMEGRQTGTLRLVRVGPDRLEGDFVGFAFSFDARGAPTRRLAPPSPRRLTRA